MESKSATLIILIVEDDANLAANLQHILELEGYRVTTARDGQTALALGGELPFDLAIIDIKLPDMSGLKLIEQLAQLSPATEYIISTGYASLETAVEAVGQKHIVAYETKPLNMDHILSLIRQLTERKCAEAALRDSEAFIATVFDSIADFITVQDIDYNILRTNKTVEQVFGKDIVGKKCYQVYQGRNEVCPDCPTVKVLSSGKPVFSAEQVSRLGHLVEIWAFPIKDEQGKITAVIEQGRDIRERKQAEEALKRSGEFFQTVFDSINDAISIINVADFTIADANRAFLELYGLSKAQVIGQPCYQISHHRSEPCVAPDDLCPLEDAVRTGRPAIAEHVHYAQDGTPRYVEVSASPIKDERGQVVRIVHVSRDISQLRQAERLFQAMANSSPVGIYIIQDGKLQLVNPRLLQMTGYSQGEVLGRQPYYVILPEDRDMVWKNAVAMLEGKRTMPYEYRLVDKAGRVRWVMETVASIQYQGKPAVLGSYMDITDHKLAEKALETQKELTDRILASTPNAILVIDRGLDIVLANQAFCQTFGVAKAEVEGKQFTDVLYLQGLAEAVTRVLTERQLQSDQELHREVRNQEMIMVAQIVPMGTEEVLLILRDATAERARQEQLYHLDRLASIGKVAAGVAHELNNPLSGVLGYSELVLASQLPQEIKNDVEVIHNNAQRAITIVRNLLAFAHRQPMQKQRLNINDLVRRVLELRAYELRVSNIEVSMELADGLPEVMADPRQLEQVFLNIILNAEQAMLEAHQGGNLMVKTELRRGMVRVSLADDGPGIPPENLKRVFDPFFTTKEPGKGTGLGLSICHGIVSEHGGRIHAESKVGKGATFFVELPVTPEEGKSELLK